MAPRDPPDNVTPIRPVRLKKDGTPAKPTGFAKGGSHYKGPALGIPASGIPAGGHLQFGSAGPSHGPEALIPGQPEFKQLLTAQGKINRELAAEVALQVHANIMLDPKEMGATRSMAAERVLNRVEGTPIARVLTNTVETVEEIRKVNARNLSLEERDALRQIIHVAKNRAD